MSDDGSFYIRVPAETPIAFQLLDKKGMAVMTHRSWMWAMPKEARGCIGCHEDREMTPPNRLAEAVAKPPAIFTAPPDKRRTVDFRHEIAPLLEGRCLSCHTREHPRLDLADIETQAPGSAFPLAYEVLLSPKEEGTEQLAGRYVKPGSARESPLVWRLFGARVDNKDETSGSGESISAMPPKSPLSDTERKLFIKWIDLGAQWNNRPLPEDVAKEPAVPKTAEERK